eukprot:1158759-Pelagomonas_calceolata.AAC.2
MYKRSRHCCLRCLVLRADGRRQSCRLLHPMLLSIEGCLLLRADGERRGCRLLRPVLVVLLLSIAGCLLRNGLIQRMLQRIRGGRLRSCL